MNNTFRLLVFVFINCGLCLQLMGQCVSGNTSCPTVAPQTTYNVCVNSPLTIPSNVTGDCSRPKCCYSAGSSNMSIQIVGSHTYISDLRYFVLLGTGPEGPKTVVLYNAGNNSPSGTLNPVTTNDYTGNCNWRDDFNVTFDYSASSTMPSICNFGNSGITGTYRPESPESTLEGIDIASYNWRVQVYDCVGQDVGTVNSITLTLTNLSCNSNCIGCGGSATAGTKIFTNTTSSPITDNSCTSSSASTLSVIPLIVPPVRRVVWNGPNTTNVVGDSFSPSTATVGTFVYSVKAQCDGADCTPCTNGSCGSGNGAVNVTVNVLPFPSASASSNSPVCVGKSVQLNSSGGISYAWSGPNGFTSAIQNPTIGVSTAGAGGIYTVTVTNSGGCTATATVSVVISTATTPTITGPSSFCPNTSISLDAGAGYASYVWSPSGNTQSISTQNAGTYTVTVSNAVGCTSTSSKTITHFSVPTFTTYTASCPLGGGAASSVHNFAYTGTWSINSQPSGANASINTNGQISGLSTVGTYIFSVVTSNGCTVLATIVIPPCCVVPQCIPLTIKQLNN